MIKYKKYARRRVKIQYFGGNKNGKQKSRTSIVCKLDWLRNN
jgi:hypothetical protein